MALPRTSGWKGDPVRLQEGPSAPGLRRRSGTCSLGSSARTECDGGPRIAVLRRGVRWACRATHPAGVALTCRPLEDCSSYAIGLPPPESPVVFLTSEEGAARVRGRRPHSLSSGCCAVAFLRRSVHTAQNGLCFLRRRVPSSCMVAGKLQGWL